MASRWRIMPASGRGCSGRPHRPARLGSPRRHAPERLMRPGRVGDERSSVGRGDPDGPRLRKRVLVRSEELERPRILRLLMLDHLPDPVAGVRVGGVLLPVGEDADEDAARPLRLGRGGEPGADVIDRPTDCVEERCAPARDVRLDREQGDLRQRDGIEDGKVS